MKIHFSICICALIVATSLQAAPSNTELCLDIARTGMIAGAQKDTCKFKGNLKDRLIGLYNARGCGNIVRREDLNKASGEILSGMRSEYAQSGKKTFCAEAKKVYSGDYEKYYIQQRDAYIRGQ